MSNLPELNPLDRRLNAYSDAVADIELKGRVKADKYVAGTPAQVSVAFTDLLPKPVRGAGIDSQLLFGETLRIFDHEDGFAWVKADRDGYVGWVEEKTLSKKVSAPSHLVCVPRTFFYPEPDMKRPHKGMRSLGSAVTVVDYQETRGTSYALLEGGESIMANHIIAVGVPANDYVEVAESLIHTPYLWAGSTAFGIDCSGFVKLAMFMCGKNILRDSDMQAATIGVELDAGRNLENLKRGDLIFWRGHVAIVNGQNSIIHANGHSMNVVIEPLDKAISRIEYLYEKPVGFRRPE